MGDKASLALAFDGEAARLLRGLYGRRKAAEPPRDFKTVRMVEPHRPMRNLNSVPDAADVYSATLNRTAMAVLDAEKPAPVVYRPRHVAPIERASGVIRSKEQIARALELEDAMADRAQAPIRPGRNTELEKARLAQQFTFKGGKALPEVALPAPVPGHVPLNIVTGKAGAMRRTGRLGGGAGGGSHDGPAPPTSELLHELKATYDAVARGMEESAEYLQQLRALGAASKAQEAAHAADVAMRSRELKDLLAQMDAERQRLAAAARQADEAMRQPLHIDRAPLEVAESPNRQAARSRSPHKSPGRP